MNLMFIIATNISQAQQKSFAPTFSGKRCETNL